MKRKWFAERLSIPALEKRLNYRHLPLNEFESPADEEEVRQKGLEQEKGGKISSHALKLGKKFHTQILSSYIPVVSIRWVHPSIGYGLFAEEIIKKDRYVGEYTGVVRRNDRRYFEPINNYCYEYPVPDEIGRNYVIDATAGCLTRFINHSSTPNLKPLHVYWKGFYHLIFLALKRIEPDEQLSFDYGESYWYIREKPMNVSRYS
ncbi:MAG: SET domain-containing protein-lysine N-methyltransferase [Rhabdochlamydiaceae bacterium]